MCPQEACAEGSGPQVLLRWNVRGGRGLLAVLTSFPAPGEATYLRNMVRESVMLRTLCRRLSSLWGSSFRNRTASTSMRKMARILFCKVGNSPAGQEPRVSCRRKGGQDPIPRAHPRGRDHGVHQPQRSACISDTAGSKWPWARAEVLCTSLPVCLFGIKATVP